jgi:EAL domain-containing protein (putative c-di-GMP-specific phosphodiesterase class I)
MTMLAAAVSLDQLLSPVHLRAAYQPIVDLGSDATVGFEALARWDGLAVTPDVAFATAAHHDAVTELDWACRAEAFRAALAARLGTMQTLFVNSEPASFAGHVPAMFAHLEAQTAGRLRVMVELTERSLARAPAETMRACANIRARGWGIALDDVGAVPESLALLPIIAPDVVKLDLRLVQAWPDVEQAQIMAAVMAHTERTGAAILAEGIENAAHLRQAVSLGATLGQGWYFGRPGPLPSAPVGAAPVDVASTRPETPRTPFDLVRSSPRLRVGAKGLLQGISRHLENQGFGLGVAPVVLSAFQDTSRFVTATARRYAALAGRCPLVAVFAGGLGLEPAPGVRGGDIARDDPLLQEWTVVVVGSHYAGALIACDLGDTGPDLDRRFAFVVTHDRDVVLQAARSMLNRITTAA